MEPSPTQTSTTSSQRRLWLAGVVLLGGWGLLTARLLSIYYADADSMQQRVVQQQTTRQTVRARPGDILDRHGRLLATSIDLHSLYAVPKAIEDVDSFAATLAPVLSLTEETLRAKLLSARERGFLWLARRLEAEQVGAIRDLNLPADSFGFEREFRRYYPQGASAVHLLGLRDIDGIGRGGVEQAFDEQLRGVDGQRVLVRDARNRVVHLFEPEDERMQPGQTLRLTIDLRLQQIVEQELQRVQLDWEPTGCCAVLADPQTGEILAMASLPDFHPERPDSFREDGWINRSIAWSYEPGSTIKPLIVGWALHEQKVAPAATFSGHGGAYRMKNRILHDTHAYGEMTLADVLITSSNIGMAQIGERLTNAGLARGLAAFGFGYPTGIGLAGELPGFVRPLPEWTDYSTGSIPMGHELMVTPLQMLMAQATLANGGSYRQPRLILDPPTIDHGRGQMIESPILERGVCRWIVTDPMKRVLTEGTGRRVNVAGLSLFGKTGTSQVYDPELGGYSWEKTVCSFVCGMPAENPELILIVVVDQPTVGSNHFGSSVAAPAAVRMLQQAYPLLTRPVAGSLLQPIR